MNSAAARTMCSLEVTRMIRSIPCWRSSRAEYNARFMGIFDAPSTQRTGKLQILLHEAPHGGRFAGAARDQDGKLGDAAIFRAFDQSEVGLDGWAHRRRLRVQRGARRRPESRWPERAPVSRSGAPDRGPDNPRLRASGHRKRWAWRAAKGCRSRRRRALSLSAGGASISADPPRRSVGGRPEATEVPSRKSAIPARSNSISPWGHAPHVITDA